MDGKTGRWYIKGWARSQPSSVPQVADVAAAEDETSGTNWKLATHMILTIMYTIKVGEFWDHRMAFYSNSPSSQNISNIPNWAGLLSATLPNCQNFRLIANIPNIPNWSGLPPPAVSKPSQLPLLPNLLSPRRTCWPSCWCCCSSCCCCCWWGRWCWTSLLFTSREGGVQHTDIYFHIVLGPKPIWHFLVGRYQNQN